jgi:NAD(P)-dependent dehydrogenase (short-subunit alcohol dehydrogenase family)
MGAQVVALGRSSSKLADLKEELPSIRTVKVEFVWSPFRKLPINLSHPSHESISLSEGSTMDMVIGGIASNYARSRPCFAVNYLSHFLLTENSSSSPIHSTRDSSDIIVLSSGLWMART